MIRAEVFCREIEEKEIPELGKLAEEIWREHYPGVIGINQTEYMLGKFYSTEALKKQMLENGHRFFFCISHEKPLGYASLDFSPNDYVMLSKFYLHVSLRGKGIAPIFFIISGRANQSGKSKYDTADRKPAKYRSHQFLFQSRF